MRVLIAPDSYKGSLSALQAAESMARGVRRVFPEAEIVLAPVADGGEGTVEAMLAAGGGSLRRSMVKGPLGALVEAAWTMLGDGRTAVIEMAAASGLPLVPADERDPMRASTFGVGELVRAALDEGAERIIIGLGGSATNDGGAGFARALGARFLDAKGRDLPDGGAALANLHHLDMSGLDPRLAQVDIQAACDVDNPLCGPRGASAVFGPQKGAEPDMARRLDFALSHFADIAEKTCGKLVRGIPGAGAAGGLGAGLMLFTGARLLPGIDIVLNALKFEEKLTGTHLVFTGEGRTDGQSVRGKAPVGVARLAREHGAPVICISGGLGPGYAEIYAEGIDAAIASPPGPASLDESFAQAGLWVEEAAERACRLVKVGMKLRLND